ncbi:fibronectin type III domain-containing protein [Aequorivita echinoideorum]|uniref:Fibronectin type III domain-containing protein n=1 Tax=Aequorivita echinoideorum TaxID=1549647 RepID=A0ABS5S2V7_9FLAO|nr:fibronectin type III domain-containing protein [Aequorivita echinoideorum]MBT0607509.1 fibronectin type III domain-containing protein [Aequorivita echinoideorum]
MKQLHFLFFGIFFILFSCGKDDETYQNIDSENPSAPSNLVASDETETSLRLTWDASTDNIGVTGYRIYQDGNNDFTFVSQTSAVIEGLLPGNSYSFYVTAIDEEENESAPSNTVNTFTVDTPLSFLPLLSEMGIFSGSLSNLQPASGVQLYEINSTLFTDYAKKQRLIRLPAGQKMSYNNSDYLPQFPDNTLISKTFYYFIDETNPSLGKKIIETRVMLKVNGAWLVGDYIWNSEQTEATYRESGSIESISYIDASGQTQNINYQIPSKQDCFTCHNNNSQTFPIGLKLRSLNFTPSYTSQNQLEYLTANGFLEGVNASNISVLPDWTNTSLLLDDRARAYMDVNCAHCHQPGGSVPSTFGLDLRFETLFENTGIYANRGEIVARFQSTVPTYRMPQLGRTIVHEEALQMLDEYIESLD